MPLYPGIETDPNKLLPYVGSDDPCCMQHPEFVAVMSTDEIVLSTEEDQKLRSACHIPVTAILSELSMMQQSCYYDGSVTGDAAVGSGTYSSAVQAASLSVMPPVFDQTYASSVTVMPGNIVQPNFHASGITVTYTIVSGPSSATVSSNGLVSWTVSFIDSTRLNNQLYWIIRVRATDNDVSNEESITYVHNLCGAGQYYQTTTGGSTCQA